MKTSICVAIAFLPFCLLAGTEPIKASNVKWSEQFGSCATDKHTTFCLMLQGALRSPRNNIQVVTDAWLRKHPKAVLVAVSSLPDRDDNPKSKMIFVWVVDGAANLNLELVRQGCFDPRTQTLGEEQKLEIPQADYDIFTQKLSVAAEFAREHKLGLWNEPKESSSDD